MFAEEHLIDGSAIFAFQTGVSLQAGAVVTLSFSINNPSVKTTAPALTMSVTSDDFAVRPQRERVLD